MTRTVLIVGCGDIGSRVARLERAEGHGVSGLVRSAQTAARLAAQGIRPVAGDLDKPDSLAGLKGGWATLYYLAPPPASGADDPRLAALLDGLPARQLPDRVVYVSTSGVYGDCGGDWVGEDRPPHPQTGRSRRRRAAEEALTAWSRRHGVTAVILRVPGIYGPGRLPLDRLRAGVPVVREDESPYSNRIHADDLAEVCFAAGWRPAAEGVYNVSDGHPTTMTDYFYRVADRFGLPRPPAISLEEARRVLSPAMLSFLEESKRLDNGRMTRELRPKLFHPDLESGLAACFNASGPALPGISAR
ncbi:SDR family oxidoreductase [Methylococcus geothermalis]|uniref:NAD-dependent epimerase/dehydratase family protein n=1 Tax=Methylococcus geothermalis TaxID=2681310 RepID=A0A858QAH1_9GAMM|nr:SDR family oxidoreductase [Methylococcus geothermalis]QJD30879.1 NAD-dependent epimerase/dehydratase family protein [Methylococcus geothermalis]